METIYYPKTVVLNISTHGNLNYNASHYAPLMFKACLPMTTITATKPGVCNFVNREDANALSNIVRDVTLKHSDTNSIIKVAKEIQTKLKTFDAYTEKPLNSEDYEYIKFLRHYDSRYTLKTYRYGDMVMDKVFSTNRKDVSDYDDEINAWIITVVNMPGTPNLFHLMSQRSNRESTATMEDIMYFLKSKGVEGILVVDFSCAIIVDTNTRKIVSDRVARNVRRKLNGGRGNPTTQTRTRRKNRKAQKTPKAPRKNPDHRVAGGVGRHAPTQGL